MFWAWLLASASEPWVNVAPFQVQGAPSERSLGLADLLAVELRGAGVPVLPFPPWARLEDACVARRSCPGTGLVVICTTTSLAARVWMDCRVLTVEPPTIVSSAVAQGKDVLAVHAAVAADLAGLLGHPATVAPPTRSVAAVEAVGRALAAIERGDRDAAQVAVAEALAADPSYARAAELRERLASPAPFVVEPSVPDER